MTKSEYGWVGKILRINVTHGEIDWRPTSNYTPEFLGGRGIAAKIYWSEVSPEITAFDPENKLIFMTGPATGTLAPSSKICVVAKSPQTIPDCYQFSSIGGHWGAELKFAGYDGVIVQGKSLEPIYIWISNGDVEILDAKRLWGMTTRDADNQIRSMHGQNTRSMVIGPAGENLCAAAVISTDGGHTTGQGHFGAVMGSKNLKAVAVRGKGSIKVARPEELKNIYTYFTRLSKPMPNTSMAYYVYNSMESMPSECRGTIPTNFDTWYDEKDYGDRYLLLKEEKKGIVDRKWGGCFACPICCDVAVKFRDSSIICPPVHCMSLLSWSLFEARKYHGKWIGRPTFESCACFNDLGLSICGSVGFRLLSFFELVEAGILTKENTGLPLDKPCSSGFIRELVRNIAYRKGNIWDCIATGYSNFLRSVAEESEEAKKIYGRWVSRPFYYGSSGTKEANDSLGMLNSATSIRQRFNDPLHLLTTTSKNFLGLLPVEEIVRTQRAAALKFFGSEKAIDLPGKSKTFEDKVPVLILLQNMQIDQDSVTYCGWAGFPKWLSMQTTDRLGDPTIGAKLFSAVTGIDRSMNDMLKCGERVWTLERCIHVREGRRRKDDSFSSVHFNERAKWTTIRDFERALNEYYKARGWSLESGIPTRAKLSELGLKDVADELRIRGLLLE